MYRKVAASEILFFFFFVRRRKVTQRDEEREAQWRLVKVSPVQIHFFPERKRAFAQQVPVKRDLGPWRNRGSIDPSGPQRQMEQPTQSDKST